MSWNISAIGSRDGVKTKVEGATCYGGPEDTNQKQFTAAKTCILSTLALIPDGKGVNLASYGHADNSSGGTLTISLTTVDLAT